MAVLTRTDTLAIAHGQRQVRVSFDLQDPGWDAFVATAAGGHHVQTSLWGQLKVRSGWKLARVTITEHDRLLAGAQVLIRRVAPAGSLGYVTKGPLCACGDPSLARIVIDTLHQLCASRHVRILVVQPPSGGEEIGCLLASRGFRPSWIHLAPTASVVLNLDPPPEALLGAMKRKTRQNISRGERAGIVVQEGGRGDLPTFYGLLQKTGERQEFTPYPEAYYANMWRLLEPAGHLKLLLATCGPEVVSALLLVPFGHTVVAKSLGWSGLYGESRPNDVLFWGAIQWAKSHDYRYFDLEGIDPVGARAVLDGRPLPESLHDSPTRFKLSFGGQVVLYPEPYDYVYNPLARWAYARISPWLQGGPRPFETLMNHARRIHASIE